MIRYIGWVLGSRVTQLMITICLQLLLARCFSPQEFGRFASLFSIVTLWNLTLSLRFPLQVVRQKNCDLNLYWSAVLVEALIVCGILGVVFFSIFSFSIDLTLLLISGFVFRVLDFVKASQERMSTHLRLLKLEQISFFLANGLIAIGAIGGGGLGFYLFGSF